MPDKNKEALPKPLKVNNRFIVFPYDTTFLRPDKIDIAIEDIESNGYEFVQIFTRGNSTTLYMLFKKNK